jgi:hypothetical protein
VVVCLAVVLAAAVRLVTEFGGELWVNLWKLEGGHAWLPLVAGAVCYARRVKILRIFGMRVWKPKK